MSSPGTDPSDTIAPKGPLAIFFAIVIGVSLIGFLRGTAHADYDFTEPVTAATDAAPLEDAIPLALSYRELRDTPRGRHLRSGVDFASLREAIPTRTDAVSLEGTSKATDLATRMERRAYDGAPPVIPHPVRQRSAAECRICHEEGLRLAARRAPMYPHDTYLSCTQCHAMAEPNLPWGDGSEGLAADPRLVDNSFSGLQPPTAGPRWTSIAPPAIAHKTFMRERCVSCHGPNGRDAMKSTHPSRQSCEQCHASQAGLEQRPGGAL